MNKRGVGQWLPMRLITSPGRVDSGPRNQNGYRLCGFCKAMQIREIRLCGRQSSQASVPLPGAVRERAFAC